MFESIVFGLVFGVIGGSVCGLYGLCVGLVGMGWGFWAMIGCFILSLILGLLFYGVRMSTSETPIDWCVLAVFFYAADYSFTKAIGLAAVYMYDHLGMSIAIIVCSWLLTKTTAIENVCQQLTRRLSGRRVGPQTGPGVGIGGDISEAMRRSLLDQNNAGQYDDDIAEAMRRSLLNEEAQTEDEYEPSSFLDVCESFVEQSRVVCQELLDARLLKKDDVESSDWSTLQTLNAVVMLRAALRSQRTAGLKLANGNVVKDSDMLVGEWETLRKWQNIKSVIENFKEVRGMLESLNLSDEDIRLLERSVLPGSEGELDNQREQIRDIYKKLVETSLALSQLDVYHRRGKQLYNRLADLIPRVARSLSGSWSSSSS